MTKQCYGNDEESKTMGLLPLYVVVSDELLCLGGNLKGIRMVVKEGVDVAYALLLEYFVDGNKDASLLNITKSIVDSGTHQSRRGL